MPLTLPPVLLLAHPASRVLGHLHTTSVRVGPSPPLFLILFISLPPSLPPLSLFLSLSFSLSSRRRHEETGKTQEFLLVPFTLFFLLIPLIRTSRATACARESLGFTPTSLSALVTLPHFASRSLTSSLARPSVPSLSVQQFFLIHPKVSRAPVPIFRLNCVFQRVQRRRLVRASVRKPCLCTYVRARARDDDNNRNFRRR